MDDERFLQDLRATFQAEADEHLGAMSSLLLQLERAAPGDAAALVESLFREAHSLKGAARSVNLAPVERVCQALERVLAALKRRDLGLSPPLVDALHAALDGLAQMLPADAADPVRAATLAHRLDTLVTAPAAESPPRTAIPVDTAPGLAATRGDTVRVGTARLEALMTQAEELQAFKFSGEHLAGELRAALDAVGAWRRHAGKKAALARSLGRAGSLAGNSKVQRQLVQLTETSAQDETLARALVDRLAPLARAADHEQRGLGQRVDRLQADLRQALMLPFSTLLSPLPRLVRDLAQAAGKEVELTAGGTTLEADRRVLEQLKTPLTHLVRNAVDHGIETPAERVRAGKAARARITIEVAPRDGHRIELAVCDDGGGIDLARVRARAEALGVVAPGVPLSAAQVADLVFASGVSTSPLITDLSGHGLGLAIVREKVEALGGTVSLQPAPGGAGTCFCIEVPATLTTYRGLLVVVAEQPFVLPSRHVERVVRVPVAAVHRAPAGDTVDVNGEPVPFAELSGVLALTLPAWREARPLLPLVIACVGERRVAFAVDEVIGDQEVLVKPLTPPLKRVRHVAGATLLGEGRVVPLLNVADLVKSAAMPPRERHGSAPRATPRGSLLLAEDSVTARQQLKQVLEAAGYRVSTAADGIDALAQLQHDRFDLLISDVEMPRLDGFDLTARVRTDRRLAGLPVVLVTALDSHADQARGVAVGANAYIAKRGFDAGRLLETIRLLL